MIYGVGVDMVQVARVARCVGRAHFVRRVYSAGEQALLAERGGVGAGAGGTIGTGDVGAGIGDAIGTGDAGVGVNVRAAETAAGCFAAKEAFLKAAGRGLGGFALSDIAALRRESGAPYYVFSGEAAEWMEAEGLVAHLSITHEGGFATAFAVLSFQ